MELFNESEFSILGGHDLIEKGEEIRDRFKVKREYFLNIYTHLLLNQNESDSFQRIFIEIDTYKFQPWMKNWLSVRDIGLGHAYSAYFKDGLAILKEFEDYAIYLKSIIETRTNANVTELTKKIEAEFDILKNNISEQIEIGINKLIELKSELHVNSSFSKNINNRESNSYRAMSAFLLLFLVAVVSIPAVVYISIKYEMFNSFSTTIQWSMRLALISSLLLLSFFAFSQYRIYQLINLKYSHLNNFMGMGANSLTQMIGLEGSHRQDLNKKIAEMYVDIDDLMYAIKKSKHPTEITADVLSKTMNEATENVIKLKKAFEKS